MSNRRPYRVLHLLGSYEVGGAESVALALCERANHSCFESAVCAFREVGQMRPRFENAGVPSLVVNPGSEFKPWSAGFIWSLARKMRRFKTDVVHCHSTVSRFYGPVAAMVARVPVTVCTHHGSKLSLDIRTRVKEGLSGLMLDCRIGVSRKVVNRHCRHLAKAWRHIPNGIDVKRFRPGSGGRDKNGDMPRIIHVGRLSPEKRQDLLLEALAGLIEEAGDVELWLVGDGSCREALERQAADLGVREHCVFWGERDDVPRLMRRCDIYAQPSDREGLPLTVLEAMASGLPVVATSIGGMPEVVEQGRTGYLIEAGSSDQLRGALARLLDNPDEGERMGGNARERAVQDYSEEAMVRQYEQLYRDLLAARGLA